jgi:hypothetical protein
MLEAAEADLALEAAWVVRAVVGPEQKQDKARVALQRTCR